MVAIYPPAKGIGDDYRVSTVRRIANPSRYESTDWQSVLRATAKVIRSRRLNIGCGTDPDQLVWSVNESC